MSSALLLLVLTATFFHRAASHSWVVSLQGKTLGRSRGGIAHEVGSRVLGWGGGGGGWGSERQKRRTKTRHANARQQDGELALQRYVCPPPLDLDLALCQPAAKHNITLPPSSLRPCRVGATSVPRASVEAGKELTVSWMGNGWVQSC